MKPNWGFLFKTKIQWIVLLVFPLNALAATSEKALESLQVWHAVMANVVAYQPKVVGFNRFAEAMGLKATDENGKKYLEKMNAEKKWPTVTVEGHALKIGDGAGPFTTIEIVKDSPDSFLINNKLFTLKKDIPIIKQLEEFQKAQGEKNGKKEALFHSMIPNAYADAPGITVNGILGTAMGATASILGAVAAGGAAGATIFVGGLAVAAGNLICSAKESAKTTSTWSGYVNCMATPLSWVGLNPLDRMYVKHLSCHPQPQVTLQSKSGIEEERTFHESHGRLEKIDLEGSQVKRTRLFVNSSGQRIDSAQLNLDNPEGPGRLERPKNIKELDEAQGLLKDYSFYKSICQSEELTADFHRKLSLGIETGSRAHDSKPTDKLMKGAH